MTTTDDERPDAERPEMTTRDVIERVREVVRTTHGGTGEGGPMTEHGGAQVISVRADDLQHLLQLAEAADEEQEDEGDGDNKEDDL